MRDYEELTYEQACQQAVRVLTDGYGEAVVIQDPAGYWALYYFSWAQAPSPSALPHYAQGPLADADQIRPPYEMKAWLEEMGYEEYLNDVD